MKFIDTLRGMFQNAFALFNDPLTIQPEDFGQPAKKTSKRKK